MTDAGVAAYCRRAHRTCPSDHTEIFDMLVAAPVQPAPPEEAPAPPPAPLPSKSVPPAMAPTPTPAKSAGWGLWLLIAVGIVAAAVVFRSKKQQQTPLPSGAISVVSPPAAKNIWLCDRCHNTNPVSTELCEVCGAPRTPTA